MSEHNEKRRLNGDIKYLKDFLLLIQSVHNTFRRQVKSVLLKFPHFVPSVCISKKFAFSFACNAPGYGGEEYALEYMCG